MARLTALEIDDLLLRSRLFLVPVVLLAIAYMIVVFLVPF